MYLQSFENKHRFTLIKIKIYFEKTSWTFELKKGIIQEFTLRQGSLLFVKAVKSLLQLHKDSNIIHVSFLKNWLNVYPNQDRDE